MPTNVWELFLFFCLDTWRYLTLKSITYSTNPGYFRIESSLSKFPEFLSVCTLTDQGYKANKLITWLLWLNDYTSQVSFNLCLLSQCRASFHFQDCPSLDDRLYGHPLYDQWTQWLATYLWSNALWSLGKLWEEIQHKGP